MPPRQVVICRAPEDAELAAVLQRELATRSIGSWPAGSEIAAEYASAELVTHLAACDWLVVLATSAVASWPFALVEMRLARELGRPVLVLPFGLSNEPLRRWLAQLPVEPEAIQACVDMAATASAVNEWSPPAADTSPAVVQFAAARTELLRVASHGGRLAELGASGVEPALLRAAALHLRATGLIDFSGPLDDERTSFITVS